MRCLVVVLLAFLASGASAKDWTPAPTLPDPAGVTAVNVSTVAQLQTAASNLQSNQLILRLLDCGEQFIKASTATFGNGADNCTVQYCLMSYMTQGTTYTNGVDVHGGDGWIIRHCRFERINLIPGGVGPAVLMWNGSSNTICEGCTFIDCETAIAFGLIDRPAPQTDHAGGIIRNNFIWRAAGTPAGVDTPDCGILVWDSPNTKVLHNTVVQNGSFPNAIEYRFHTTGAEFRFNLCDGAVMDRGGGTSANTSSNNVTNAAAAWFVSALGADLRLSASAPASVVDAATTHADVGDDYDANVRPAGSAPDVGASERGGTPPVPTAPTAPSNCLATNLGGLSIRLNWTDTSNNETGFRIERSDAGGAFAAEGTVGAGVSTFTNTGLTAGVGYTYRIFAFNATGDSTASNSASATATVNMPINGPGSGSGGGCVARSAGLIPVLCVAAATIRRRRKGAGR